jgi:opacity protein-like surface antigen
MNKKIIASLIITIGASSFNLANADEGRGIYVGAFGGAGRTDNQQVEQTGTAHKTGFDLLVDVKGKAERDTSGLIGASVGYEWAKTSSNIKPAIELEVMYTQADQKSRLVNSNDEIMSNVTLTGDALTEAQNEVYVGGEDGQNYSAGNHRFFNQMNMKMGLFMANGIFTYDTDSMFKPYVGAGLGMALVRMTGATSYQTNPHGEPYEVTSNTEEVVNYFNSKTKANDFALAGQIKLGIRAEISKHVSAFAEYRYLYVDSTDFTFGSTVYPGGHSPTDNWNVKNNSMGLHNGLVGVQYSF